MLQNVHEQVLRIWCIFGGPITDAFHVMPLEDRVSVIAKTRFQCVDFALFHVIQPQFVDVIGGCGIDAGSLTMASINAAPQRMANK